MALEANNRRSYSKSITSDTAKLPPIFVALSQGNAEAVFSLTNSMNTVDAIDDKTSRSIKKLQRNREQLFILWPWNFEADGTIKASPVFPLDAEMKIFQERWRAIIGSPKQKRKSKTPASPSALNPKRQMLAKYGTLEHRLPDNGQEVAPNDVSAS